VARARVVSGAAVQTDSLQLLLELTRARVSLLARESALRVTRLQLGRRIGAAGPVDAVPLDTLPMPDLPLTLADAISEAAQQGPGYRVARANERAARAIYRGRLGDYLPHATLTANAWRSTTALSQAGRSDVPHPDGFLSDLGFWTARAGPVAGPREPRRLPCGPRGHGSGGAA